MVELFVLIGIFSLVITLMGMILLSLRKKLNLTIFQLREKQTTLKTELKSLDSKIERRNKKLR